MIDKRLPFPRSELGRSGLTSRDFRQIITNLFSRQRLEWLHPAAPLYSRPIRASATAGQVEGGGGGGQESVRGRRGGPALPPGACL